MYPNLIREDFETSDTTESKRTSRAMLKILRMILDLSHGPHRKQWWVVLGLMTLVAFIETVFTALFYLFAAMLAGLKDISKLPGAGFFAPSGEMAGGQPDVSFLAVVLIGVIALRALAAASLSYKQASITAREGAQLGRTLLEKYLHAPFLEMRDRPSWYLVRNISNSVDAVFSGIALPMATILSESLVCIGIFTVLMITAPVASLGAALVTLGLAGIVIKVMHPLQFSLGASNQELIALQFGELAQAFSGIRETKVFSAEQFFVQRFADLRQRITANNTRIGFFSGLPKIAIETVFLLVTVSVVAWLLAKYAVNPHLLALLGLYAYAGLRLMPSAARIIACFNLIRMSQPALEEVAADYRTLRVAMPASAAPAVIPRWKKISLEHIYFQYPQRSDFALRDVSMSFERGQAIGITGKSGAGKSTLIDLILGLLQSQSGRIVGDSGFEFVSNAWVRGKIGYVPQQPILLNASVRQNIAFGEPDDQIDDERVVQAAKIAQISEYISSLAQGYDTNLGELGNRLSGGQKQRVAIARALYYQPEFIVFDEATSALDLGTENEIVTVINALKGKVTALVVAHRLNTIKECDKIILMEQGAIIAEGGFYDLLNGSAAFRELVELHELA